MDEELITPPMTIVPYLTDSPPLIELQPPTGCQTGQGSEMVLDTDWANNVWVQRADGQRPSSPSASLPTNGAVETINGSRHKGKISKVKKDTPPRIAFHTRSGDDILDDGYRWRKYGQKFVKNNIHPRSYYRCSYHTCNVKKQIQRLPNDPSIVVTTYEGIHNHPCEKLMETLSPLVRQLQFLTRL